jgi:DNA-binding MurR/RpiR family transcriptional regulator
VVCTGLGNSAHVASLVSARLRREGLVAISIVPGEIDLAGTFMARSVRAVVLVFSVSGESEETIKIANRYVRNGSCVVAITSHVESTLSKLSNITFYAPSNFNQKGHSRDLEGMITPLFVAEALVEEYEAQLSQNEEETQL